MPVEYAESTPAPDPRPATDHANRDIEFATKPECGVVRRREHLRAGVDPASLHFLNGDTPTGMASRLQHREIDAAFAQRPSGRESGGPRTYHHHSHRAAGFPENA